MDLLSAHNINYKPMELIDGYESLIWTERYQEPGDFQLVTAKIEKTANQIPPGALCVLSDSEEIMIVETHEIKEDEKGETHLHVSGRSFESFLENRIALDDSPFYNKVGSNGMATDEIHTWFVQNNSWNDADAARYIIDRHTVSPILTDVNSNPDVTDIIPNFVVWSLDTSNRRYYARYIERTDLHSAVMDIIKASGHGIRNARPSSDQNLLRMVLFAGVNRTYEQSTNSRVVLEYEAGHISDFSVLRTIKNHKNAMYVYPKNSRGGLIRMGPGSVDPNLTGMAKKALLIDATEITATSVMDISPSMGNRAASEMAKHGYVTIVDCKVNPHIDYQYRNHYYLGDIVTVRGTYGFSTNMRVTEYIRVENDEGEIGYPGLSHLE